VVMVALATSAFALPAAAQLNMSSVYVGGSLGRSDFKAPSEADPAGRIFGGYQFHRNFAAEIGYHDLGQVNFVGGDRDAKLWEAVGIGMWAAATRPASYGNR